MIIFITKKAHNVVSESGVLEIRDTFTHKDLSFIKSLDVIGFDLETTDLDPYNGNILLMIIGNKEVQYVIDNSSINCAMILFDLIIDTTKEPIRLELYKEIVGANLKFDYKFIKAKFGITFMNMFDVMIAERRITQGTGFSCSLEAITERRLGKIPSGMIKSVREEFIGVNPMYFKFENKHIKYAADDISQLFDIRTIQKEKIKSNKLEFLIYDIEFPLIRVLADIELEGMNINEDKWNENIRIAKDNKFQAELELDQELKELRDAILPVNERQHLSNGKFDRVRQKEAISVQNNLFGDLFNEIEVNPTGKNKKKPKIKSPYVNYASVDELLHIFGRLKQPAPTIDSKKESGPYLVPKFKIKKLKNGTIREIIDKGSANLYKFTTGAGSIESYLIENPNLPIRKFIKKLIEFRKFNTRINTFGEEFLIKYKNRVTGKFHTVYRQCDAITGRLQSGDKKNGWYNSQNIPKDKQYREPFHSGIDYIITTDLSGAEAVIMIDKARDEKFYQLAIVNDDAHSPLATAVWRTIGNYRLKKLNELVFKDMVIQGKNIGMVEKEREEALKLSNITISKKENSEMRTKFKNNTFADIYGCGAKKYAKTLNISIEEAKIAQRVHKTTLPKTYKMVESNERFALEHGYIILNKRTNSRIWYLPIFEAKKNHSQIPGNVEHEVRNSARNGTIQGTQADMVKEMMVEIDKESRRQNLKERFNFMLLGQVHDELIARTNDITTLVEFLNDDKTIEMVTIPEFKKKWMCQVANRYLSFIKMSAEQHVGKTWTK